MGQGIKSRQTGCSSVFWMCVGFMMSGTSAYHWGFGWARHCERGVNATDWCVKGAFNVDLLVIDDILESTNRRASWYHTS